MELKKHRHIVSEKVPESGRQAVEKSGKKQNTSMRNQYWICCS